MISRISLLLVIFLGFIFHASGQQPVLTLSMDETQRGSIDDQSGNNHTISMNGGLSFVQDRFGNDCRAIEFDGRTGYLSIPFQPSLNLSTFSVSAWINLQNNSGNGFQWVTLMCKGEDPAEGSNSPAYRVQLTSATASVNTESTKSIGTVTQRYPSGWFHLAVTYDGQDILIYQNGTQTDRFYAGDPLYRNREALNIGRDVPGNTEYFSGVIDDFKLFDGVLSSREINALASDNSYSNFGSACPPPPAPSRPVASNSAQNPRPTRIPQPDIPDFSQYEEASKPINNSNPVPNYPTPNPPPQPALGPIGQTTPSPQPTQPSNPQPPVNPTQPRQGPIGSPPSQSQASLPPATQPVPTAPRVILPAGSGNGIIEPGTEAIPRSPLFPTNVKVSEPNISMYLYDHRAVDQDTVNIYIDGKLVLSNYELQRFDRAEGMKIPIDFLSEGESHTVSVIALNYGSAGTNVNTVGIIIDGTNGVLVREKLVIKRLNSPVGLKLTYRR